MGQPASNTSLRRNLSRGTRAAHERGLLDDAAITGQERTEASCRDGGTRTMRSSECLERVNNTHARQGSGTAGLPPISDELVRCRQRAVSADFVAEVGN